MKPIAATRTLATRVAFACALAAAAVGPVRADAPYAAPARAF